MKHALVLVTALVLCWTAGAVVAQGDKSPDIKEIMGQLNKPTGLYYNIGAELKSDTPDWAEIQPQAKEVAKLAAALGKNKPPKGDVAAWEKRTKEYAANAAALQKAIAAKDKPAAKAAFDKMGGNLCMTCHKAHKPE
jgi:cytochrome c556